MTSEKCIPNSLWNVELKDVYFGEEIFKIHAYERALLKFLENIYFEKTA